MRQSVSKIQNNYFVKQSQIAISGTAEKPKCLSGNLHQGWMLSFKGRMGHLFLDNEPSVI